MAFSVTTSPELRLLDVGHGNSAVLARNGKVMVVDAGGRTVLLETLKEMNVRRVDIVLISHADADHISGLQALLEEQSIEIGTVFLNSDAVKDTKIWKDVLFELEGRPGTIISPALTTSDTGKLDIGDVNIEVVAPAAALAAIGPGGTDKQNRRLNANSMSAVVRICWKGAPIALLAGDLDEVGLSNATERGANLTAEVLVFPHHGGRPGSADVKAFASALLAQVKPSAVVFSNGRGKYATPHPDIAEVVRGFVSAPRICCTQLSEHCADSAPRDARAHLLPLVGQGRERGHACAGTLLVTFGPPVTVSPSTLAHDAFIADHAAKALCKAGASGVT